MVLSSIKKQTMQDECRESLIELREQVVKTGELISAGENLAALRLLIEARVWIRQAVVSTILECLQRKLNARSWSDHDAFERDLVEISRLVEFMLVTLCPECKQQIYAELSK